MTKSIVVPTDALAKLTSLAPEVMRSRGLEPNFPGLALQQLATIQHPAPLNSQAIDLRHLPWCSIDNETSKDLDQLTCAENNVLWVAVADVDALVSKDSPIDQHAQLNTTTVYTPTTIFSMIPEKLSTDLTSLSEHADRLALIIKMTFSQTGHLLESSIFPGLVHNYAKLTYRAVGAWLEKLAAAPEKVTQKENLKLSLLDQHKIAQLLRKKRMAEGALLFENPQLEPRLNSNRDIVIESPPYNAAHQLIEECMIAANIQMAHYFLERHIPYLRRVVRVPKYWDRMVSLAHKLGGQLPSKPDSRALAQFLSEQQKSNPSYFPILSLSMIKLLGRGEYVVVHPHEKPIGHFGLGLPFYTHSTAPNRRYPDLIAQRLFKEKDAYTLHELDHLARHCTQQEEAATKVERRLNKSAAAIVLSKQIGTLFKGIISGASHKGTWVHIFNPPVDGKVVKNGENLDVGEEVTVRLIHVDVNEGYIDFIKI